VKGPRAHRTGTGGIEFFDLLAHCVCGAVAEPFHHDAHSESMGAHTRTLMAIGMS
jgi:hypothetical protein